MMLSKEDSIDLMQRISNQEYAALKLLMKNFSGPLFAFAYRFLGTKELAEEVVQDVFMNIWRKASDWQPKAQLSTFLFQMTRNRCIDETRKASFKKYDEISHELPDSSVSVSERFEKADRERLVKQAVFSLPERQKTVLILCYYEDMSQKEAASVMKISVSALEGLLFRAKKALKEMLKKGDVL